MIGVVGNHACWQHRPRLLGFLGTHLQTTTLSCPASARERRRTEEEGGRGEPHFLPPATQSLHNTIGAHHHAPSYTTCACDCEDATLPTAKTFLRPWTEGPCACRCQVDDRSTRRLGRSPYPKRSNVAHGTSSRRFRIRGYSKSMRSRTFLLIVDIA